MSGQFTPAAALSLEKYPPVRTVWQAGRVSEPDCTLCKAENRLLPGIERWYLDRQARNLGAKPTELPRLPKVVQLHCISKWTYMGDV
jgi:hypothetical protein